MILKTVPELRSPLSTIEVWAWACLCGGLMAINIYPNFGPHFSNDSYQYLSVAENTVAGHFGCTSLVYYDAERSFGVIPAPMVHFPLGYPLASVVVSLIGIPFEKAALLVSAISIVSCVPLLAWLVGQLGLSRLLGNVVVGGFVFNGRVIYGATSILSEALFTLVLLLGVALLVAARRRADTTNSGWRWAAAGFALGATYWVRYAGLFVVIGLAALVLRHLIASNRLQARGYALAVAAAGAVVLVGIARNMLLIGSWQETVKEVSHPFLSVVMETVRAGKNLFLGPTYDMPAWTSLVRTLLIVCLVGGLAGLAWTRLRHRTTSTKSAPAMKGVLVDLLILMLTYSGCMFYAGLTTNITYSFRMFLPLTPLLWLLIGFALSWLLAVVVQRNGVRRAASSALVISFCCYVILNCVMIIHPPTDYSIPSIERLVASRSADGKTAGAAILELAGPEQVIVANDGQAVGYALKRPTVSLADSLYSRAEWNDKAVYDIVGQYDAAALVIYTTELLLPSPFVRELARGESPPWMKLVYQSSDILVYRPASRMAKLNELIGSRTSPEQPESGSR
jgi:hypothetical protein